MNRPIKFRGKRIDNGEWAVGSFLITDDNKNNPMQSRMPKKRCQIVEYCAGDWNMGSWDYADVDPTTVGQFTGLTDKNGKGGYYGDAVEFTQTCKGEYQRPISATYIGIISDNKFFQSCIMVDGKEFHIDNLIRGSIIGNIHDSSELIKTK